MYSGVTNHDWRRSGIIQFVSLEVVELKGEDKPPAFTNIPDQHLRMTNITKQQLMDYYREMFTDEDE